MAQDDNGALYGWLARRSGIRSATNPHNFSSAENFGSSSNPHNFSAAKQLGSGPNPHSISIESLADVGGTSHILNAAARSASQPRNHSFGGGMPGTSSPIIAGKTGSSQPGRQQRGRQMRPQQWPTQPPDENPGAELAKSEPVYPGPESGTYRASADVIHPGYPQPAAPHKYGIAGPLFDTVRAQAAPAITDGAITGRVMPRGWVPPIGEL